MKFIEIREGLSVRKDEIISVEQLDGMTSRINTESQSFESNFPYTTILMLLEKDRIEESIGGRVLQQYFAG